MSDHFLTDEKGRCNAIVTIANIYEYKGFVFEFHSYCGPSKLKKNWEPAARQGIKFFRVIDDWLELPKAKREATRLSG